MAQPHPLQKPWDSRASPSLSNTNSAAGNKRKRAIERKFYAVKEGKSPGIYDTWDQCLTQVRGHKGALFKAFPSLHEAQAFIDGKALTQPVAKQPGEQKFYAVQNGKVPGVYTEWPAAQAQISGVRNPKHKKFNTRAEAEAFVLAGRRNLGYESTPNLSPEEEIRRLIVRNAMPGLVTNGTHAPKDKEGNIYELGRGPLPPGAEDGFDPNIKLAEDGTIINKTAEEKAKTKVVSRDREPPGMLRIYTDGSSLGNGQAGARAGVGVFFGPQDPKYEDISSNPVYTIDWVARGAPPPSKKRRKLTNWRYRNVSEALKGSKQTNQRAELTAILRALDIAPLHRDVTIYTDSRYSIDCVTNWYKKWAKNGWMNSKGKPVENIDLVMDIREKIEERDVLKKGTFFMWVKGHANDVGNIAADRLAFEGAAMARVIPPDIEKEEGLDDAEDAIEILGSRRKSGEDEDDEVREAYRAMEAAMEDGLEGEID